MPQEAADLIHYFDYIYVEDKIIINGKLRKNSKVKIPLPPPPPV